MTILMSVAAVSLPAAQQPARSTRKFEPFTAQNAALVLLDQQPGLLTGVKSNPSEQVKHNVLMLASLPKATSMPAFITTSHEDRLGAPLPELQKLLPDAYAKRSKRNGIYDLFEDPEALRWVKAIGRKKLVIAGLTTDVCGQLAATHGAAEGYEIRYVADASGSVTLFQDQVALGRIQQSGATLVSTFGLLFEFNKLQETMAAMKDAGLPSGDAAP